MKIISVYMDDHDKPLLGRIVVNDDAEDATVEAIEKGIGEKILEAVIIDVDSDDTVEDLIAYIKDRMGEEEE